MRHFRLSIAVTVILMALAGWWGYEQRGIPGMLQALWITGVLGVLQGGADGAYDLVAEIHHRGESGACSAPKQVGLQTA